MASQVLVQEIASLGRALICDENRELLVRVCKPCSYSSRFLLVVDYYNKSRALRKLRERLEDETRFPDPCRSADEQTGISSDTRMLELDMLKYLVVDPIPITVWHVLRRNGTTICRPSFPVKDPF